MSVKGLIVGPWRYAARGAVGEKFPALLVVMHVGHHDLAHDLLMHGRVLDRDQGLDAAMQVARHPVGGSDIDPGARMRQAVACAEADDAAVLEEAADDALDADILGETRNAGPQAADAAHHEIDLDASLARRIERIDDARIDERIELGPDLAGPAFLDVL